MPTGITLRMGGGKPPRLRRYQYGAVTAGAKLTAARIGATINWDRGTEEIGGWLAAAVVDTLIQAVEENIYSTAPYGPDPPTHPAWSGHPHMLDSINSTLRVDGRDVRGHPDAASRSHAYGEVFVGFPWRFLEYGTVKMPARPFVEPAYEAAMQKVQSVITELMASAI